MTQNKQNQNSEQDNVSGRGFASMDREKQREIASKGGKNSHKSKESNDKSSTTKSKSKDK